MAFDELEIYYSYAVVGGERECAVWERGHQTFSDRTVRQDGQGRDRERSTASATDIVYTKRPL